MTLLPIAFVMAVTLGVHAVWWAFPLAEIVSITISGLLFMRISRNKIRPMYAGEGSEPLQA